MKTFTLMILMAAGSPALFAATAIVIFPVLPAVQGNGTTLTQGNTYNGVSPATINGIPSQELVCDDFDHTTYVPTGAIDFSTESIANLAGARQTSGYATGLTGETGTMSEVQAYETAAVLAADIEALPQNSANAQAVTDFQYALWYLMEPTGTNGSLKDAPLDANAKADLQTAFTAVTTSHPTAATLADEAALVIYTPTAAFASNQEFLGFNPTPEPSTWILMSALGLLFLAPQVRFRLRSLVSRNELS